MCWNSLPSSKAKSLVGWGRFEIWIPGSQSLKEKRQVILRLMTQIKRYNLSLSEVEGQNTWQRSTIEVAVSSPTEEKLRETHASILRYLNRQPDITLLSSDWQVT